MSANCYQCHDQEGEVIDGLCDKCYSARQEAIFRQVFGDEEVDSWSREAETSS